MNPCLDLTLNLVAITKSKYFDPIHTHMNWPGALWVGTMALSPPLGVTSEADDVLPMAADELSVQVTSAVLETSVYLVELQTKVREDFTITEIAPTTSALGAFFVT